ncbi:hypothetical protein MTBLM5_50186 [Magnetospirillum sp. LM-5]|nr:hypothetical protein MTBLM5_50186 [Magnetospirillum sp. LM-5]
MVVFAVVLLFPFLSKTVLGSTRGRRLTGLAAMVAVLLLVLLA